MKTNEEIAREIVESWFVEDVTGYVDAKRRSNLSGLELLIKEALDAKDDLINNLRETRDILRDEILNKKDAQTALSKEDEEFISNHLKWVDMHVRVHGDNEEHTIRPDDFKRLLSLARRGSSPQAFVTDEEIEAKATMIFAHMLPDNISRVTAYNSALELVRWVRSKLSGTEG